jgi:hypothetical protein
MFKTDLVNLINEKNTWAFIGNGLAIDSGGPSWKELVTSTLAFLEKPIREELGNDQNFSLSFKNEEYAKCFSRIEYHAGREKLETAVAGIINGLNSPGNLLRLVASWPFKGYVTTNYDSLLEKTIEDDIRDLGWVSVGNSENEIRKVGGDVSRVVWHIHGACQIPSEKSKLILTEEDYDELYLNSSPAIDQLRALLAHSRIVFIGFGFKDPDITHLFKQVKRLTNPARPAFAFLGGITGSNHEVERQEYLKKYNIDAIPYRVVDGVHGQLQELLETYGSFILRRSLIFGQPDRPCPSYNPETTGLLIYNELCLKGKEAVSKNVIETLLKARILARLEYEGSLATESLMEDLSARIKVMGKTPSQDQIADFINNTLSGMSANSLIEVVRTDTESRIELTKLGRDFIKEHAGISERLDAQFRASLLSRTRPILPKDEAAATRVAKACETFIKECVNRRTLGIAMTRYASTQDFQSYHMVALLQTLPEFMEQLSNTEEAIALTKLTQGVLSKPSVAEEQYMGLSLQAKFGEHLLGYDPDTIQIRISELKNTLFLVDSTTLIAYLARSSVGHETARLLINHLRNMNSYIASTDLLSVEVAEHARYALRKFELNIGLPTIETLKAATGRAGERTNAFLDGFIEEAVRGAVNDFLTYLSQIAVELRGPTPCNDENIQEALRSAGINCYSFNEWEGFSPELYYERDVMQNEIARIRQERKNYKHERQVKAEAEALLIIKGFRNGNFCIESKQTSNAYFISHTRIIDNVAGYGSSITMRPEFALQWIATINPLSMKELRLLTCNLLSELAERNFDIVDKSKLAILFSPLVNASREKRQEEIANHASLISNKYGVDASKAFTEPSELDLPVVMESYFEQAKEELTRLMRAAERAIGQAKLGHKERTEFEHLKAEKKERKKRALRAKRKAASKHGGKKHK